MKKMRVKILILTLFVLPLIGMAQDTEGGYYAGYIVDAQGDTIRGNIRRENNYVSPETVTFRANGSETEYGTSAIRAFYIEELNFLFESYTISKNQDSNTTQPISGSLSNKKEIGTHFLLTVAKTADYGFYSYTEKGGLERLYFKKGDNLDELLFISQYVGETLVQEKKRYRIQLLGLLIGCEPAKSKINSSTYASKSMEGILKAYARCKGDEVTYNRYAKTTSGMSFSLGLTIAYGGIGSSKSSIESATIPSEARIGASEHEGGSSFEFGLVGKLATQRDSRVSFKGELKVKRQTVETMWSRATPVTNVLSQSNYTYKHTFISFGLLADFNLAQWSNGRFFLETGLIAGTAISGSFESTDGIFRGNGVFSNTSETTDVIVRESDYVLAVGLGAQFDKFGASFRLTNSVGDNPADTRITISSVRSVSLNLFYLFN